MISHLCVCISEVWNQIDAAELNKIVYLDILIVCACVCVCERERERAFNDFLSVCVYVSGKSRIKLTQQN